LRSCWARRSAKDEGAYAKHGTLIGAYAGLALFLVLSVQEAA
jgi:hypothetical protein